MRTVQTILDTKPRAFNQVDSTTSVIDALNFLNAINLSYLVVTRNGKYQGLFTERDYSRNIILRGRRSDTTTVAEAMTVDLPVVHPTDTVENCMQLMNAHKSRYVLVFDEHSEFAGVITIHDLLRQVLQDKDEVFDHPLSQLMDQEKRIA